MKNDRQREKNSILLRERGFKSTPIRLGILAILQSQKHPLSCEDIFSRLEKILSCDLATVYRNLTAFQKSGITEQSDFGQGKKVFELAKAPSAHADNHHHHVVCTKCKAVQCVPFCGIDLPKKQLEQLGFSKIQHKLEFFALCPNCGS